METHLQIRHIGNQDDQPQFVVVRGTDMKQSFIPLQLSLKGNQKNI